MFHVKHSCEGEKSPSFYKEDIMSKIFDIIMGLFITLTGITSIIIVELKLYDYMIVPMILLLIGLIAGLIRGFINE